MNKFFVGIFLFVAVLGFSFTAPKSAYAVCSVYWNLSPLNPSPNQEIAVTVIGIRGTTSGWANVHLLMDGNQNGITRVVPAPYADGTDEDTKNLIYRYKANAGAVGSQHTLTFQADGANCTPSQSFTTGGGAPVSKIYITPNTLDPGGAAKITFTSINNCSTYINTQEGAGLINCVRDTAAGNDSCNGGHGISGDNNPCWWRKSCTVTGNTGTYTANFNLTQGDPGGNCSASLNYQVGSAPTNAPAATNTPVPGAATPTTPPGATATVVPTPTPAFKTVAFRYSDVLFDKNSSQPEWESYTEEPAVREYKIKNAKPGQVITIFGQFKNETNQTTEVMRKSIRFVGPDPVISSVSCQYDAVGEGTRVSINGSNFGDKGSGKVTVDDNINADVLSWNTEWPTPTPVPPTPTTASISMTPNPSSSINPTSAPSDWTINAEAVCSSGAAPIGKTWMSYAIWPPNPFIWQRDEFSTGIHTQQIIKGSKTADNQAIYVGLSTENQELELIGTPPNSAMTYLTLPGSSTPAVRWYWDALPTGSYNIKFQAPEDICPSPTSTPYPTTVMFTPGPTPKICTTDANCGLGQQCLLQSCPDISTSCSKACVTDAYAISCSTDVECASNRSCQSSVCRPKTKSYPTLPPDQVRTPTPTLTPSPLVLDHTVGSVVLGISSARSVIEARTSEKLTKGRHKVDVLLDDGRKATGYCNIGFTSPEFAVKNQCRPSGNFSATNVRIQIYEKAEKVKPIYDQKVSLKQDGLINWVGTPPQLEIGKKYIAVVKAPKGLGVKREFTAETGTTVLSDLSLPVGDIAPPGSPDNIINSNDYGQLRRDWVIASNPTTERAGDLNGDSRVNSLDYSCMRANFGNNGEGFLTGQ